MPQKKSAKNKKIKQKQKQSQKVNQKVIVNINTNKNKSRRVKNQQPSNNKISMVPNNYNIPSLIVERPTEIYKKLLNELNKGDNKLTQQTDLHKTNALVDSIENKSIQLGDVYDPLNSVINEQNPIHAKQKNNDTTLFEQKNDDSIISIEPLLSGRNKRDFLIKTDIISDNDSLGGYNTNKSFDKNISRITMPKNILSDSSVNNTPFVINQNDTFSFDNSKVKNDDESQNIFSKWQDTNKNNQTILENTVGETKQNTLLNTIETSSENEIIDGKKKISKK